MALYREKIRFLDSALLTDWNLDESMEFEFPENYIPEKKRTCCFNFIYIDKNYNINKINYKIKSFQSHFALSKLIQYINNKTFFSFV